MPALLKSGVRTSRPHESSRGCGRDVRTPRYDCLVAHPKKKWGQNFLRNRGAVGRIVEAIDAPPDELLLEIGPGEGVLTEKLAELPNELEAIEIDPDLAK